MFPADSDLVERVAASHDLASGGRRNEVWAAPYGSDLRLMTNIGKVPTLQYGPGDVALAHGPDENVLLDDVQLTARTLALIAHDICGVA